MTTTTTAAADTTSEPPAELNAQIIKPLVRYLRAHGPTGATELLAERAGTTVGHLERDGSWLSVQQVCAVFEVARSMLEDDREFTAACTHELVESYGPMVMLVRGATPGLLYQAMARTMHHASKVSTFEARDVQRASMKLVYRTQREETRLLCLSRQAQLTTAPRMWKLPRAKLRETSCVAWGDDCCTYELSWHEAMRKERVALPAVATGILGAVGVAAGVVATSTVVGVVVLTILLAVIVEQQRLLRANIEFSVESSRGFEQVWTRYERATREILDLHDEQQTWNAELDRRVTERTEALQQVVERLQKLRKRDHSTLIHVSHDIRNPLTLLSFAADFLADPDNSPHDAEIGPIVDDMREAIASLDRLVGDLLDFARAESRVSDILTSALPTQEIVERARRRINALTLGRDIRCSVFRTRDTPEVVVTDTALFNRILDNLLTNAVKYTERGSILLEIDGVPDHLCLKLSDTGRGMSSERIESVFTGHAKPDPDPMLGTSNAIGLGVVVRLLDRLSGRLEILSRVGVGTTVWLYLPTSPLVARRAPETWDEPLEDVVRRIVHVRPVLN